MFNFFKSRTNIEKSQRDNNGYTLVEIVFVMVIIAIVTITIPLALHQRDAQTSISSNVKTNPNASTGNIIASQTNADPKVGPVEVDGTQYEQCEGVNLAFYAYTSNILLSLSNNDRACS